MNRSQLVALADAIGAVRPDWQQPGILAALNQLAQTWTRDDAALAAHAMAVAAQPNARTPAAFSIGPLNIPATPTTEGRQEQCHICGRTRGMCALVREKEIRRGVPDPHDFETIEEAERNKARHQIDARQRARVDAEEARRRITYQAEELPEPRRVQEPWPEPEPEEQETA